MSRGDRIYARGNQLWCRVKDERGKWINEPTHYLLGQEDLAKRFAKTLWEGFVLKRAAEIAMLSDTAHDLPDCPPPVVYVVASWPLEHDGILKIGWSSDMWSRLSAFATTAPNQVLLAYWARPAADEKAALAVLSNWVVRHRSEVFIVPNYRAALRRIDMLFGERLGGATVKHALTSPDF